MISFSKGRIRVGLEALQDPPIVMGGSDWTTHYFCSPHLYAIPRSTVSGHRVAFQFRPDEVWRWRALTDERHFRWLLSAAHRLAINHTQHYWRPSLYIYEHTDLWLSEIAFTNAPTPCAWVTQIRNEISWAVSTNQSPARAQRGRAGPLLTPHRVLGGLPIKVIQFCFYYTPKLSNKCEK